MQGSRSKVRVVYKKSPSGEVTVHLEKRKDTKARCALCNEILFGASHERGLSKSEKRPSAIFAGTLCNKCRKEVLEEAIKVKEGIKKLEECDIMQRKYIKEALNLLE